MTGSSGNRVLLCDDDELVRSVVRRLMEDAGYDVVAEADSPASASTALGDLEVDVVVLDLALRGGHGEHLLAKLRSADGSPRVIVFSAYVGDAEDLVAAGATAVVDKPHFERLDAAVRELLGPTDGAGFERRRPISRPGRSLPAPTGTSFSGLEPWQSFVAAAAGLAPGDTVIAFDIVPSAATRAVWDHVYRADFRLALARTVASSRRPRDRISLDPAGHPVALLVGTHPEGAEVVFARLERTWRRDVGVGFPVGAYAIVGDDTDPGALLDQTIGAVQSDDVHVERALRMV